MGKDVLTMEAKMVVTTNLRIKIRDNFGVINLGILLQNVQEELWRKA